MNDSTLRKLSNRGQSIWLDYIRRDFIENGKLKQLIEEDDVKGMTSNPSIFEMAIAESTLYDSAIQNMTHKKKDALAVYESITQHDVQKAADEFLTVFKNSKGHDGYVSLEVNPHLAHNTIGTVEEIGRAHV